MAGYWKRSEESAKVFTPDGFLLSGDAGYLDAEGYLFICDRIKDMIISGGENVYAAEVESIIAGHPAIREAAIVGVPDERWGEAVHAVIVLEAGETPGEDEFRRWCRARRDRKSVVWGKSVSVRVDLGGRRFIKKKNV